MLEVGSCISDVQFPSFVKHWHMYTANMVSFWRFANPFQTRTL